MGYSQWVSFNIMNNAPKELVVKNASITSGSQPKWFRYNNKDNETAAPDGTKIPTEKENHTIGSCGRSDAASGTTGSFDLYEGDTKVTTISWDCPGASSTNSWTTSGTDNDYVVNIEGGDKRGAIGTLTVKVSYSGNYEE
ncbi:hypothetical protein BGZ83_011150 [Gryganskiella cystojenkinii]|nr:hypothetical protein BGZ83_011150 [Gryganskiella cystojenkinii]